MVRETQHQHFEPLPWWKWEIEKLLVSVPVPWTRDSEMLYVELTHVQSSGKGHRTSREEVGLEGSNMKIWVAFAEREGQNLTKRKGGSRCVLNVDRRKGFRSTYMNQWMQGQSWKGQIQDW